jgi:uncharacterized SAM-binding protein YcdF (DUF218 family)
MKKLLLFLILLIFSAAVVTIQYPSLLTRYARLFSVNNATRGADAMVVLSGGIIPRLPYAIELYQQGYAPRIILTQARHPNQRFMQVWGDEWSVAPAVMRSLNTKVNLVYLPSLKKGGVTSTFDEAYDLRDYCLKNKFHHLIIVTDLNHTRRALLAFEKVLAGTGIQVEAAGAPNDIFNESNWWQTDTGISAYIMEGIKYVVYFMTDKNVAFIKNY